MFENIEMAPRDAILGLTEAFVSDPNRDKINLSVGVYQDASGRTPILDGVGQRVLLVSQVGGFGAVGRRILGFFEQT